MSSYLGIAAAFSALKQTLGLGYTEFGVSASDPELGAPSAPSSTEGVVRIFPYRVAPSPTSRNDSLPTHGSEGQLRNRPRVTMEVQALICFLSTDHDLNLRVMGATAAIVHSRPFLNRDVIADETLATFLDRVNVTLDVLSADDLSKLWSSLFEIDFCPCLPIRLGGVVIEGAAVPTRTVLPVRTPTLYVRTFGGATLDTVEHQDGATTPIEADQRVILTGTKLRASSVRVRIGTISYALKLAEADADHRDALSPTEITFALYTREASESVPLDGLRAGIWNLQVLHDYVASEDAPDTYVPGTRGAGSNAIPIAIRPRVESDPAPAATTTAVVLTVVPDLLDEDVAELSLIASDGSRGYLLRTHELGADGEVTFTSTSTLAAGTYTLRLQVNGLDHVPTWSGTAFVPPTVTVGA